jgi:hypothetical protein
VYRKLLFHDASNIETIAGIEDCLPRNGPHRLPKHVRLDGFIGFPNQNGEQIGRGRRTCRGGRRSRLTW